jgi:hypothetical protein
MFKNDLALTNDFTTSFHAARVVLCEEEIANVPLFYPVKIEILAKSGLVVLKGPVRMPAPVEECDWKR